MKVSRNFLNDFVDTCGISTQDLADKLVSIGNEYDAVYKLVPADGLVIGEVLECEMHPDSKKLHVCQVNLGSENVQIVCGAPNMRKGLKVIVAKVGANLPGGVIKKAMLAGYESNGMCCSLEELGISHKFLKKEDVEGIYELPLDAPVGKDPLKYLGLDDEVIDFDFTSNRADMLSMIGIAYETAAAYDKKVMLPNFEVKEISEDINESYKLSVETSKCLAYLGRLVRNVVIKESPDFIKNRLIASDIRPINNVVDISNYVMLEYGTPLHFFDADKLGSNVIVRCAKDGEDLVTLDGNKRCLCPEDIVIANEDKAVCLAGVMGGEDTEVTDNTKNIFVECAIFDGTSVRITSKKILRSEASSRFEKGIDPNRIYKALDRAAYLLNKYASGDILKGVLTYDTTSKDDKKIEVTLEKINNVLGMNLTSSDVISCLEKLGFKVSLNGNLFTVLVPTRRLDVNIKEDIIEEVGRIYGYDKIVGVLPTTKIKRGGRGVKQEFIRFLRHELASYGLNQVITYSLVSDKQSVMFENGLPKVYLLNPMSEDRKVLRTTLLPSLFEVFEYNLAHNVQNINIFETGSIYFKDDDYKEESCVAGLMYGEFLSNLWQGVKVNVDFYVLKGLIDNLLNYLGFNNRVSYRKALLNDMHPGRCAEVLIDNVCIGFLGEVSPKVSKKRVYVFELNISRILEFKVKTIKFKELSKYPSVSKDVAFVCDKNLSSLEIEKFIRKAGGRLLTSIQVFDVYEGENVPTGMKSIAYNLVFSSNDRTLSEEEVMTSFNNIIDVCEKSLNVKLRDKNVI